jgi:hypothetical protein
MITFTFTNIPAHIESVTFAKRKPRSDSESAVGVKRLQLWLNVAEKAAQDQVLPLFPGVYPDEQGDGGAGLEARSKRKLGVVKLTVADATGRVLFESSTAKGDRPRLVIGKEATTAWLILPVEVAIPRDGLVTLDDYFKADVVVSVSNAQIDLTASEEVSAREAKAAKRAAAKAAKAAGYAAAGDAPDPADGVQ